jgi:hypothetical protein
MVADEVSASSVAPHALHISVIDGLISHPVNPTPTAAGSRDNGTAIFQGAGATDFVTEVVLCAVRMNSLGLGDRGEHPESREHDNKLGCIAHCH